MTDLVSFLKERLDEDEAQALAASKAPWRWDGSNVVTADPPGWMLLGGYSSGAWVDCDPVDVEFVTTFDPARVLREVEAKRRIINEHPCGEDGYCYDDETHSRGCKWLWPCPTLRLLALPYTDHDVYRREEWMP